MRHRHLDLDPDTPAAELDAAALDDLLDRGDLDDWAPLLREIRRDPSGTLGRRMLELLERRPPGPVTSLWRNWILERRSASPSFHAGAALRATRLRRGSTQQQVAARLGMTQPEVSKLEARADVRLSTLRAYVTALGGTLVLSTRFGDEEVDLVF